MSDTEALTKACIYPDHEGPRELPVSEFSISKRDKNGNPLYKSYCKRCVVKQTNARRADPSKRERINKHRRELRAARKAGFQNVREFREWKRWKREVRKARASGRTYFKDHLDEHTRAKLLERGIRGHSEDPLIPLAPFAAWLRRMSMENSIQGIAFELKMDLAYIMRLMEEKVHNSKTNEFVTQDTIHLRVVDEALARMGVALWEVYGDHLDILDDVTELLSGD